MINKLLDWCFASLEERCFYNPPGRIDRYAGNGYCFHLGGSWDPRNALIIVRDRTLPKPNLRLARELEKHEAWMEPLRAHPGRGGRRLYLRRFRDHVLAARRQERQNG